MWEAGGGIQVLQRQVRVKFEPAVKAKLSYRECQAYAIDFIVCTNKRNIFVNTGSCLLTGWGWVLVLIAGNKQATPVSVFTFLVSGTFMLYHCRVADSSPPSCSWFIQQPLFSNVFDVIICWIKYRKFVLLVHSIYISCNVPIRG